MTGRSFYFCSLNNFFYRFDISDNGETSLACRDNKCNAPWVNWPILANKVTERATQYRLQSFQEDTQAFFTIPKSDEDSPQVVFRKKSSSGPAELTRFPLEKCADESSFKKELTHGQSSDNMFDMPFTPRNSLDKKPESQSHHYLLSERQKTALRAHKTMLENRKFDYRILSYFFKTGYSRQDKIQEITNLLNGNQVRSEVIEQGRTGQIVLGF